MTLRQIEKPEPLTFIRVGESPTNQKLQNKNSCLGLLLYSVLPGTCSDIVNAFKVTLPLQPTPETYGHASTKTTEVYTPLTKRGEEKLKSPLDFLEGI